MENDHNLHPFGDVSELIRKRRYNLETKRGYLSLFKNIIVMVIFILIVFTQVFLISAAKGTSMYPAILDGDILLGFRLDKNYIKGDVVICEADGKTVIGRVVAKSGDSVMFTDDGILLVNGTEQTGEIAFPTYAKGQGSVVIVPQDCVYILGDYRTHTQDSRDFGPVEVKNVKAKVVSILRKRGI